MDIPAQIQFCNDIRLKIEQTTASVRESLSERNSGNRARVIAKLTEATAALDSDIGSLTAEIRNAEEKAKREQARKEVSPSTLT